MTNHFIEGRAYLEGLRPGAFAETLAFCLERGGVVHFSHLVFVELEYL